LNGTSDMQTDETDTVKYLLSNILTVDILLFLDCWTTMRGWIVVCSCWLCWWSTTTC